MILFDRLFGIYLSIELSNFYTRSLTFRGFSLHLEIRALKGELNLCRCGIPHEATKSGESLFLSKDFPCSQRRNPQKYRDEFKLLR